MMLIPGKKIIFGYQKILRKKKNKEYENIKENKIQLKIVKNLRIFKLSTIYIKQLK